MGFINSSPHQSNYATFDTKIMGGLSNFLKPVTRCCSAFTNVLCCNCNNHKVTTWMRENRLLLVTILAVVSGVGIGFSMRLAEFDSLQRYYWGFLGDVIMM